MVPVNKDAIYVVDFEMDSILGDIRVAYGGEEGKTFEECRDILITFLENVILRAEWGIEMAIRASEEEVLKRKSIYES